MYVAERGKEGAQRGSSDRPARDGYFESCHEETSGKQNQGALYKITDL